MQPPPQHIPPSPTSPSPPPAVRRPRGRWTLLTLLPVGYGLWLTVLGCSQDGMLYPGAFARLVDDPPRVPAGVERLWIEPEPGVRVEAWHIVGRGRSESSPGPAVIVTHGNYECIDHGLYFADQFRDRGVSVLLVEYRGFGRSTGRPSQEAISADLAAFYDLLAARPDVDRTRIVAYGRSLGGAAAAQLAAQRPVAAVILESAFSSMDSMAARYLAPSSLVRDHWRTDDVLPRLGKPVLLIHGRRDATIPVSESRRLHALTPGSELVEYDGGHTDLAGGDAAKYWGAIGAFLKQHDVLPTRPAPGAPP